MLVLAHAEIRWLYIAMNVLPTVDKPHDFEDLDPECQHRVHTESFLVLWQLDQGFKARSEQLLDENVVVSLLPQVIQLRHVALIAALQSSHSPCFFEQNPISIILVHIFKLNCDSHSRDQVQTFEDFSE